MSGLEIAGPISVRMSIGSDRFLVYGVSAMAKLTDSGKVASPPNEVARKVGRSAKTGEFVTKKFAKEHPSTTVVETVKIKTRSRGKKA